LSEFRQKIGGFLENYVIIYSCHKISSILGQIAKSFVLFGQKYLIIITLAPVAGLHIYVCSYVPFLNNGMAGIASLICQLYEAAHKTFHLPFFSAEKMQWL
jgi:hypothetical protein